MPRRPAFERRACNLQEFKYFLHESRGHNLALTVVCVPCSLDSGSGWKDAGIDRRCHGHLSLSHTHTLVDVPGRAVRVAVALVVAQNERPVRLGSGMGSCTDRNSSQFRNNYFTERCSGSEAGSYLRLIDFCITQLQA